MKKITPIILIIGAAATTASALHLDSLLLAITGMVLAYHSGYLTQREDES